MNERGNTILITLVIVAVLALGVGIGIKYFMDETRDWKTFINNYGYKIQYPSDIIEIAPEFYDKSIENSTGVVFKKIGDIPLLNAPSSAPYTTDFMDITTNFGNPSKLSLREWDKKRYGDNDKEWQDVIINGLQAIKRDFIYLEKYNNNGTIRGVPFENKVVSYLVAIKDDQVMSVSIKNNHSDELFDLFEKILSTLSRVD